MMDEINDESDFEVEGPLWIQVHAMDKGLEVTVTRAQISVMERKWTHHLKWMKRVNTSLICLRVHQTRNLMMSIVVFLLIQMNLKVNLLF